MIYWKRYFCLSLLDIICALYIGFYAKDPYMIADLIIIFCTFRTVLRRNIAIFIGKSAHEKRRAAILKDIKKGESLDLKQATFLLVDYEFYMPDIST